MINYPKYIDAVHSLVGTTKGIGGKSDGPIEKIYFPEGMTPPAEEQIQAKLTELQSEYESKSYARARASAYPSITDVVVALAEKEEGDDTMWKNVTALRQKVKSDIPKPT